GLRRLVKVAIEEEKADDQMRILFDEFRDRLHDVAFDQIYFFQMTEEAVAVVFLNQLAELFVAIGSQFAALNRLAFAFIFRGNSRKTFEAVEPINPPRE